MLTKIGAMSGASDARKTITRIPAAAKIVQIGTSLTDNGYQDPSESSSTIGYTARGADGWIRAQTRQAFDFANVGIAGNTIQQMIDRFDTDVLPHNPDLILFEAGVNDASLSYEEIIAKLSNLYGLAESNDIAYIPYLIPYKAAWSSGTLAKFNQVRAWQRANYPQSIDSMKYYNTSMSDDGTHWDNEGGFMVAKAALEKIRVTGSRSFTGAAINSNPNLSGTGGSMDSGITGSAPDGMHLDIEAGSAGNAVALAMGDGLQMGFTPNPASSVNQYQIRTNPLNVSVEAGKTYELFIDLDIDAWDGWAYYQARLYEVGQGSTYDLLQRMDEALYPYPSEGHAPLLLRTASRTAVGTSLRIYLEVGVLGGASGTGSLRINEMILREVV